MRKNPRYLLWLIIGLTVAAVFINLPKVSNVHLAGKTFNFDPNAIFTTLKINAPTFREGLDIKGGTSLVLRADMKNIPSSQRDNALSSAKSVIERRANPAGTLEPLIQTSVANNDYRVIVELPGVTDVRQAINLIGKPAQLT